jgi:fumarate reductase flavoprotein subunit
MDLCWDEQADVIVAGSGAGGLMAALTMAENGLKVLVLEKADRIGGKLAIAIGSFTASETAMQSAAGVEDSHDDHLEDLVKLAKTIGANLDLSRARLRIEEDNKTFARLVELGVTFSGPHPEAPHRRPRMHNIVPSPASLIDILQSAARRAGATVRTQSPLTDVLLDDRGRVAGVAIGGRDGMSRAKAGAVVFAVGDCVSFLIAARLGAKTVVPDRIARPLIRTAAWPHVEPSHGLFEKGAVLIDRSGRKHSAALLPPGTDVPADEELFVVIDAQTASQCATAADDVGPGRDGWKRTGKAFIGTAPGIAYAYLEDCRRWSWYFEARSITAAARQIRCSEEALAAAFGRPAVPPIYLLGPLKRILVRTNGGLVTDTSMRVLGDEDKPIAGLYAAGDTALWFEYAGGHGYGISWATTSGRLAGAAATAYLRERNSPRSL